MRWGQMARNLSMAKNRSNSRAVLITALGNFVPPIAAFATAPILAHALGVTGRGEVSAAQAPMLLFAAVFTLGLPEAATYVVSRSPRLLGLLTAKASLILVAAGVAGTFAAILLAPFISGGDPDIEALVITSSIAIGPVLVLTLVRGAAIGLQAWWLIALERCISSLLRLGALVLLLLSEQLTVLNAVYVNAWYLIIGALAYLPLLSRSFRRRLDSPDQAPDRSMVATSRLLQYSMGVWFGSLAGVLLARVDQLLIVPLAGSYELGLYAVAVAVAEIPLLLNNTVREVMFAADARGRDDRKLTSAARVCGVICLLAAAFIGCSMWVWLPPLFGADFVEALPVAVVLLVSVVVGPPGSIAGAGLAARGLPKLRSVSLLCALLVNVALVVILVPQLGAMGAAWATLVGNLVSSNMNIYFASRRFGIAFAEFYKLRPADFRMFIFSLRGLRGRRAD